MKGIDCVKEFSEFRQLVKSDGKIERRVARQVYKKLADVPAVSLMGRPSVQKLADNIAEISLDTCLSILATYHAWLSDNQA